MAGNRGCKYRRERGDMKVINMGGGVRGLITIKILSHAQ